MNFNKALPVLTACVFLNFMRLFWQNFVAVKMKAWMHAYLKSGGGGKRRIKRRKENNQFGIKFIPKPKSAFFLIVKEDMQGGQRSSKEETVLCRNCHASPPILTCTGPFVVCRTCKLSACCHS